MNAPSSDPRSSASALSSLLADAVERASAATLRVHARRGLPASGIALGGDLVLAADHTIDPSREKEIRVGLPDGSDQTASVVGRDPSTDLAVLRLASGSLPAPDPAAEAPRVGALTLLLARPASSVSASLGLLSGTGGPVRTRGGGVLERYFLVDAVMYPGFSGGPLVDTDGGVLGLSTSGLSVGGQAIAIPWDLATGLARTIAEHGGVRRGFLGIGSQPVRLEGAHASLVEGQESGLLVVHVTEGGPAGQAGFLQGDILVTLHGSPVASADDLQALLGPESVGIAVPAVVIRGGSRHEMQVTVGARG